MVLKNVKFIFSALKTPLEDLGLTVNFYVTYCPVVVSTLVCLEIFIVDESEALFVRTLSNLSRFQYLIFIFHHGQDWELDSFGNPFGLADGS